MKNINSIKLFPNNNDKSKNIAEILACELEKNNLTISDNDYQLAIAIGGDGSFLRMLKNNKFNDKIYYIGVNAGTLGFLQEVKPENIPYFINDLINNQLLTEEVGIQETIIEDNQNKYSYYSLNEIVLRNKDLNTTILNMYVDNHYLDRYAGDGVIICTSVGSTAYNKSYGGSMIYNSLHTLQITPIAPINNEAYKSLNNSIVIPEDKLITIIPERKDFNIAIDGEKYVYDNVYKIETSVSKKRIKCLRMKDYNYTNIVYDKFLK